MATELTELADNVRKYRRRAGMSQEELAHAAGVSPGTVRKVEQGGTVRMETLHSLARALEVTTATLLAPDAPQPVGRAEDANRVNLIELRATLTPPVGLADPGGEAGEEEPNVRRFRRAVHDGAVLYHSDSYKSVASNSPDYYGTPTARSPTTTTARNTARRFWPEPKPCNWPAATSRRSANTTSLTPPCPGRSPTPAASQTF